MKQTELRIGNYVALPNNIVVKISREDFAIYKGFANIEDYNPIPLTEEWLLKFGFEKEPEYGYFKKQAAGKNYPFIIHPYNNEFLLCDNALNVKLHNPYFALTNEELCLQSEQK
jgi:hypothetical protein